MALLIVLFVVCVAVPVGSGVLLYRRGRAVGGGLSGWGQAASARFGRVGGPVVVLVIGYVVTTGVGLALGFLAKSVQSGLDEPVFTWVQAHRHDGSKFTTANDKLTELGLNTNVQLVILVSGLIFVFAYRRRWWLPVLALAVSFVGEKYLQRLLGHIVDRGHPPTTLGTYPSGGVGRILAVYGTVVVLAVLLSPRLSRAWRAGLWTGLATAAVVEAYTRVYLSLHWFTDAAFGLAFGALLLCTHVTAVHACAARDDQREGSDPTGVDAAAPA